MSTREVLLDGGSPWGFRMHGGVDCGLPLKISRVNPGSKAALRGVREGDVISTINSQSAKSISITDAHTLLRNSGETLRLGLNEDTNNSPKRRTFRNPQENKHELILNSSPPSTFSRPSNGESTGETAAQKGGPNTDSDQLIDTLTSQTTPSKLQRQREQNKGAELHLAMDRGGEGGGDGGGKRDEQVFSPNSGKKCRARRARKARMVQRRRGEPVKEVTKATKEEGRLAIGTVQEESLEECTAEILEAASELDCDLIEKDCAVLVDDERVEVSLDQDSGPSKGGQKKKRRNKEGKQAKDDAEKGSTGSSCSEVLVASEEVAKCAEGRVEEIVTTRNDSEIKGGKGETENNKKEILVKYDSEVKGIQDTSSKVEATESPDVEDVKETKKEKQKISKNNEKRNLTSSQKERVAGDAHKMQVLDESSGKLAKGSQKITVEDVKETGAITEEENVVESQLKRNEVGEDASQVVLDNQPNEFKKETLEATKVEEKDNATNEHEDSLANEPNAVTESSLSESSLANEIRDNHRESERNENLAANFKPSPIEDMFPESAVPVDAAETSKSIVTSEVTSSIPIEIDSIDEKKESETEVGQRMESMGKCLKDKFVSNALTTQDPFNDVVDGDMVPQIRDDKPPGVTLGEECAKDITSKTSLNEESLPKSIDGGEVQSSETFSVSEKIETTTHVVDIVEVVKKVVKHEVLSKQETRGDSFDLVVKQRNIGEGLKPAVPQGLDSEKLEIVLNKNKLKQGDAKMGAYVKELDSKLAEIKQTSKVSDGEPVSSYSHVVSECQKVNLPQEITAGDPLIDLSGGNVSFVYKSEEASIVKEDFIDNQKFGEKVDSENIDPSSTSKSINASEELASPTLVGLAQHPSKPIRKHKPSPTDLTAEEINLLDQEPSMSNQEEVTLRSFLHSLNLAEPSESQLQRQVSEEMPLSDRYQAKRPSEDFYIPQQRYLEVILEENNDSVDNDRRNEKENKVRDDCEVKIIQNERGRQRNAFDHFKSDIKLIPVAGHCTSDWSMGYDDFRDKQSEELRTWVRNCRPVEVAAVDRDVPHDRDFRKARAWKEVSIMETDDLEDDSDREPTKIELPESSGEEEVRVQRTSERHDGVEIVYIDSSSSGSVSDADEEAEVKPSSVKNPETTEKVSSVSEPAIPRIDMSNLIRAFEEKKIGPKFESEKEILVEVLEDCNVGYVSKIKNRFEQPTLQEQKGAHEAMGAPEAKAAAEAKGDKEAKGGMLDTFNEFASMVTSGLKGTMERFSKSIAPSKVEEKKSTTELDKEFEDYVLGVGEYSLFKDDDPKLEASETKIETDEKTVSELLEVRKETLSPTLKPTFSRQLSSSSDNTSQNTIVFNNNSPSPIDFEPVSPKATRDGTKLNPNSLKVLSISKVISMPYGIDILKQVGFLTKQFESPRQSLYKSKETEVISEAPQVNASIQNVIPNLDTPITDDNSGVDTLTEYKNHLETQLSTNGNQIIISNFDYDDNIDNQSVDSHLDIKSDFNSYHSEEDFDRFRISPSLTPRSSSLATSGVNAWLGTPTNAPNLLVCLSPSQRRSYHGGDVPTPEEAERLLDLHKKFSERRSHNENDNKKQFQSTNQYDFVNNNPQPAGFFTTKKLFIEKRNSLPDIWSRTSASSTKDSISGELCYEDPAMNQAQYESMLEYNLPEIDDRGKCPDGQGQESVPDANVVDVGILQREASELDEEKLRLLEKQIDMLAAANDLMEKHLEDEFNKESEANLESPATVTSAECISASPASDPAQTAAEKPCERDDANKLLAIIQGGDDEKPLNEEIHLRTIAAAGDSMNARTGKPRPVAIHLSERDRVLTSPSWIGDHDKFKDDMLSDWLSTTRGESREAVIDETEVKKDFKETFSYWTQRERGIFDSCIGKKEERKVSSFLDDKQKQRQAIKDEFLRSTNVKMKETREILSDRKRLSLPQEQFDKQLKEVQTSDAQGKFVSNLPPKTEPREVSPMKPKHERQQDFHEQLQESIERRRHSYQDHESKNQKLSDFKISKQGDIAVNNEELKSARPKSMPVVSMPGEVVRLKMYNEYMNQVAERVERRKQKVLKISAIPGGDGMSELGSPNETSERKLSITRLENEFLDKVKERMGKLGIRKDVDDDDDGGYERRMEEDLVSCSEVSEDSQFFESSLVEDYVIEGDVDMTELPPHLQEYLALTSGDVDDGIWSPGQPSESIQQASSTSSSTPNSVQATVSKFEYQKPKDSPPPSEGGGDGKDDVIPVVWTPRSAGASPQLERKEFRPVPFESPTLKRKNYNGTQNSEECSTPSTPPVPPPAPSSWDTSPPVIEHTSALTSTSTSNSAARNISTTLERRDVTERRLTSSKSAPASGLYTLSSTSNSLPRAQNPTITLLQKAREGQLPRGAQYLQDYQDLQDDEIRIYSATKADYDSETERIRKGEPRPKIEGIGPTTKDGMPIVLRSNGNYSEEVKDENHGKWYKKMYDSLHRAGKDGKYPYTSAGGYQSEPDHGGGYDSDYNKYATLDRRRIKNKENDYTLPRNRTAPHPDAIKYATDIYKNQPGRIENYQPGHSSISDKETKQWWDEVLDIFDGAAAEQQKALHQSQLPQIQQQQLQKHTSSHNTSKSYMTEAFKESGYASDSTLVFKRRDEHQSALSPVEHKMAYKSIQKGGEVPLHGFRKLAPERPKDSEIEYFPLNRHLTRIRIHKNPANPTVFCYPITKIPTPVFSTFKRTAPSFIQLEPEPTPPKKPPPPKPYPPKRRSSYNNTTLRLFSDLNFAPSPRHRVCHESGGDSNVKYLRDRLTHKLGVTTQVKNTSNGLRMNRKVSLSPVAKKTTTVSPFGSRSLPVSRITSPDAFQKRVTRMCSPEVITGKRQVCSELRSRKAQQEACARLSRSPDYICGRPLKTRTPVVVKPVKKVDVQRGREALKAKVDKSASKTVPSGSHERCFRQTSSLGSTTSLTRVKSRVDSNLNVTERKSSEERLNDEGNRRVKRSPSETRKKREKVEAKTETKKNGVKKVAPNGKAKNGEKKKVKNGKSEENGKKVVKKSATKTKVKEKVDERTTYMTGNEFGDTTELDNRGVSRKSDRFFQSLFLRDLSPTPSLTGIYRSASIVERAKRFDEEQPDSYQRAEPNYYLTQRRPVSESKFKSLDRAYVGPRSLSPFPRCRHEPAAYHSMSPSRAWSPVAKERSSSEPPPGSPLSSNRSISPYSLTGQANANRSVESLSTENEFGDVKKEAKPKSVTREIRVKESATTRPATITIAPDRRVTSLVRASPARSESPSMIPVRISKSLDRAKGDASSRQSSPSPSRSPSSRRIRNRTPSAVKTVESIAGLRQKIARARSAENADKKLVHDANKRSVSSLNIPYIYDYEDYQNYVLELMHATKKSARFKELASFYASLERVGQLQRTTSTGDLRPRMKSEDKIIDYDRWKCLRTKERASHELKLLQNKLLIQQKERDLLYQPKDVNSVRWRGDRGLRVKEKSVEDLKQMFGKLNVEESELESSRRRELDAKKDVYKPLWRGSSVLNLAGSLDVADAASKVDPKSVVEKMASMPRSKYGRGRLWSSLSTDQVNALKSQLTDIYNANLNQRKVEEFGDDSKYVVDVTKKRERADGDKEPLHVRCNSLLTRDQLYSPALRRREARRTDSLKADSISSLPSYQRVTRSLERPPLLSETEKKRLSMTLSKEVLDRVRGRSSAIVGKETRGAVAAASASLKSSSPENVSPRTCYSLEFSEDGSQVLPRSNKNDFLLVLTPTGDSQSQKQEVQKVVDEWAKPKTDAKKESSRVKALSSETESASSEASVRTVIRKDSDEVVKKVEYFENKDTGRVSRSASDVRRSAPVVDHHRTKSAPGVFDTSRDKKQERVVKLSTILDDPTPPFRSRQESSKSPRKGSVSNLRSSHSFTDLKDLFGERHRTRFESLSPVRRVRQESQSPIRSPTLRKLPPYRHVSSSSTESLLHSRSSSPDPTKYYRRYLQLVKMGDVHRLKNKFESLEDLSYLPHTLQKQVLKRYRSDPELARDILSRRDSKRVIVKEQEMGDVDYLRRRYELADARGRIRRRVSPVHKLPLRDRFMPHINIISKLASLQRKINTSPVRDRGDGLTAFHKGEVEKIRDHFETKERATSLLGQMYTSTPDFRELRDIRPYLGCEWVAHRHPDRSLSPDRLSRYETRPRPASSSPVRHKRPSILKIPQRVEVRGRDVFADQKFDPAMHRPAYRYQPPAPESVGEYGHWKTAPSWWWQQRLANPGYLPGRPTVTFKGGDIVDLILSTRI